MCGRDWSSDVCSSDLAANIDFVQALAVFATSEEKLDIQKQVNQRLDQISQVENITSKLPNLTCLQMTMQRLLAIALFSSYPHGIHQLNLTSMTSKSSMPAKSRVLIIICCRDRVCQCAAGLT